MQPTSASILKSGWGMFMLVAGGISVILDISSPHFTVSEGQSVPLFGGGSFTLGWLLIVVVMIVPAALMRQTGGAPIHKFFAFLWCFAVFIGWNVLHELCAGGSSNTPPRPNLAFIGGLTLCWRLLTMRVNTEKASVPDDPAPTGTK
jgi:hypothetical protein